MRSGENVRTLASDLKGKASQPSGVGFREARQALQKMVLRIPLSSLALLVLLAFFAPFTRFEILSTINLANITRQSSVLLLAATGGTFAILLGGIDLSVGSVMSISGVMAAVVVVSGVHPILGIIVGCLVGTGFGFLNGAIIARLRIPPIITTLATMFVVTGVVLAFTHGYPIVGISEATTMFRSIASGNALGLPNIFLLALGTWLIGFIILKHTILGRHVYAVGGNRKAARIAGINVVRTEIATYALAGFFSGSAGVFLMARLASGHPQMGDPFLLDAVAAVFVGGTAATGGVGGVLETLIGTFIVTVLNNGMQLMDIDPFFITLVKGVLILVALVVVISRSRSPEAV